jgi:hypothetical protein
MLLTNTHSRNRRLFAQRPAVSPVIATLLLIAIAVAAAIIVYAFVTGLIGGLSSGSGSNLYPTTATLVVPRGISPGTLVITVLNSGNSPIIGIQVVLGTVASGLKDTAAAPGPNLCMGELPAGTYCNGVAGAACPSAATSPATFCNSASLPIDAANTLGVGGQVSASVAVQTGGSALQSGMTYSFTVTIDTASGSSHTELVTATAQL